MEVFAALLAVLLAVSAVVFVARPFLAEPEAEDDRLGGLTPAELAAATGTRSEAIEAWAWASDAAWGSIFSR